MLKESLANALDDPAMDLALKQERVDGAAEIVDDSVALDYDDAGIGVDLYLNDVASVRKGLSWRLPSLASGGDARADYGIAGVERSAEIVGGVVRFVGGDLRTDSESFGKNFGTLRSAPGLLAADGPRAVLFLLPGATRSRSFARGDVLFDGSDGVTNAAAADLHGPQRRIGPLAPSGEGRDREPS